MTFRGLFHDRDTIWHAQRAKTPAGSRFANSSILRDYAAQLLRFRRWRGRKRIQPPCKDLNFECQLCKRLHATSPPFAGAQNAWPGIRAGTTDKTTVARRHESDPRPGEQTPRLGACTALPLHRRLPILNQTRQAAAHTLSQITPWAITQPWACRTTSAFLLSSANWFTPQPRRLTGGDLGNTILISEKVR